MAGALVGEMDKGLPIPTHGEPPVLVLLQMVKCAVAGNSEQQA